MVYGPGSWESAFTIGTLRVLGRLGGMFAPLLKRPCCQKETKCPVPVQSIKGGETPAIYTQKITKFLSHFVGLRRNPLIDAGATYRQSGYIRLSGVRMSMGAHSGPTQPHWQFGLDPYLRPKPLTPIAIDTRKAVHIYSPTVEIISVIRCKAAVTADYRKALPLHVAISHRK